MRDYLFKNISNLPYRAIYYHDFVILTEKVKHAEGKQYISFGRYRHAVSPTCFAIHFQGKINSDIWKYNFLDVAAKDFIE